MTLYLEVLVANQKNKSHLYLPSLTTSTMTCLRCRLVNLKPKTSQVEAAHLHRA